MTATRTLPRFVATLIQRFDSVQVELHGKYSVERVAELHVYQRTHTTRHCLLIMLATPLPCLATIVCTDFVSLHSPRAGYDHNVVFWVRVFCVAFLMGATLLEQARRFVTGLPLSTRMLAGVSVVLGVCSAVYTYLVASALGFPIPFIIIVTSPCFMSTFAAIGVVLWGKLLRESQVMRQDFIAYIKIMTVQYALTLLYPAYNFVFIQLTGIEQTLVALLLPLLKLVAKNVISLAFVPRLEDYKPEVVIFNVEVFHALFVSCCMQSSTSWTTTIALMGVDFLHAWSSLRDVDVELRTIEALEAKLTAAEAQVDRDVGGRVKKSMSLMEKAMYYVYNDEVVKHDASIRLRSAIAMPAASVAVHPIAAVAAPLREAAVIESMNTNEDEDTADGTLSSPRAPMKSPRQLQHTKYEIFRISRLLSTVSDDRQKSLAVLSTSERIAYVANILKVLHIAEFLLLIEFVEVIIPVVYCVYLTAMFFLPNRIYYPQLARMDTHSLLSTIGSTLGYACLEFVSFIMLSLALRCKLQVSPVHQLAFVLQAQWYQVQSKLILWVVFAVHISLEHFGYDYTFRFAWLQKP